MLTVSVDFKHGGIGGSGGLLYGTTGLTGS